MAKRKAEDTAESRRTEETVLEGGPSWFDLADADKIAEHDAGDAGDGWAVWQTRKGGFVLESQGGFSLLGRNQAIARIATVDEDLAAELRRKFAEV